MQEVEVGNVPAAHVWHMVLTRPYPDLHVWQADELVQVAQVSEQAIKSTMYR